MFNWLKRLFRTKSITRYLRAWALGRHPELLDLEPRNRTRSQRRLDLRRRGGPRHQRLPGHPLGPHPRGRPADRQGSPHRRSYHRVAPFAPAGQAPSPAEPRTDAGNLSALRLAAAQPARPVLPLVLPRRPAGRGRHRPHPRGRLPAGHVRPAETGPVPAAAQARNTRSARSASPPTARSPARSSPPRTSPTRTAIPATPTATPSPWSPAASSTCVRSRSSSCRTRPTRATPCPPSRRPGSGPTSRSRSSRRNGPRCTTT